MSFLLRSFVVPFANSVSFFVLPFLAVLVSLHTIARELSSCLPPSASDITIAWDKVSKPDVEAVQNAADDYLNLLVGVA